MTLKLVEDFNPSHYQFWIDFVLDDPMDPLERTQKRDKILEALNMVGIKDYKLFDRHTYFTLNLRDKGDYDFFMIAYNKNNEFALKIDQEGETNRALIKKVKHIYHQLAGTPLEGRISVHLIKKPRTIIVNAQTGRDFLIFDALREKRIGREDLSRYYPRDSLAPAAHNSPR